MPSETTILWITGQEKEMSDSLLCAVENYFENGGNVLIQLGKNCLPEVVRFLKKYNIDVGNNIIIDRMDTSVDKDEVSTIIFLNREHPISKNINTPVVFPLARSVQVGEAAMTSFSWIIFAQSGRGTWAETNIQTARNGMAEYCKEDGDIYGPVSVGVIVTPRGKNCPSESQGQMIVLGNLDFISDKYFNIPGNRNFFMSIIRWCSTKLG